MFEASSRAISRRSLLPTVQLTTKIGTVYAARPRRQPRIAAVITEYRRYSHAQHILDRFLWGYGWGNRHHYPPMDLVSVYVDQIPQNTLIYDRLRRFPSLKKYSTIAEALTLGGNRLAVDGVILIGEHGNYPKNEKGQTLYPRYEFFQEIVNVFRDSNRSVPVFNDKHLSWRWDWAKEFGFKVYPTVKETLRCGGNKLAVDGVLLFIEHGDYPRNKKGQILYPRYELFQQVIEVFEQDKRAVPVFNDKHLSYDTGKAKKMVEASKRLRFPMLAGSSLPVTWRIPAIEFSLDGIIEEALMVGVGSSDAMDYHALEALQCMVERRQGGESGVKSVQLIQGDAVWKAAEEGRWSKKLLEAALSRSNKILGNTLVDARPQDLVNNGQLPRIVKNPTAYFIEHSDGLRTTLLMLNEAVADYTSAAKLQGMTEIQSTLFYLPPEPNVVYSACLAEKIEEMIKTGRAPYPVERTLLVSGILDHCLESKIKANQQLETPRLRISYQATKASHFCQT